MNKQVKLNDLPKFLNGLAKDGYVPTRVVKNGNSGNQYVLVEWDEFTRAFTIYDSIVLGVVQDIVRRHHAGVKEYGGTFTDEITSGKKGFYEFNTDLQEELMDGILYLRAMKHAKSFE